MKLAKSLLLGSAAALVATAGASAADLPSKKAAPVQFVQVCSAYGAGFFTIPGTDTCIKVGGRVRADFAMSGQKDVYGSNVFAPGSGANNVGGYFYNNGLTASASSTATSTSGGYGSAGAYAIGAAFTGTSTSTQPGYVASNGVAKSAQHLYGWEARGRVDLDARTPTGWGTLQTVASIRLARTTGMLSASGPALGSAGAGAALEAAYIRFAGFTFGAARDNFAYMPSVFYGTGHWGSFANGAKQIAYTAVLGGGFSATVAVQDALDTMGSAPGVNALGTVDASGILVAPASSNAGTAGAANGAVSYSQNNLPQINARVDFEQAWGGLSVMGAVNQAVATNTSGTFDKSKTAYAIGAGARFNLPMIASGDTLWLSGAYAEGMTEYTTNWTSNKSSDVSRNVGGYVVNHPSWIVTSNGIELVKSWSTSAVFQHFWTPQWRQGFVASYGAIDSTTTAKSLAWSQSGAFGDAKVWNVGTQLTWLPTRNFEIGVDVLYARVEQDIRRLSGTNTVSGSAGSYTITPSSYTSSVTKEKAGNWTGRLRVERTF
jgi:hypothetical protein